MLEKIYITLITNQRKLEEKDIAKKGILLFFLHKFWTNFKQTDNFKQIGIYSQKSFIND